MYVGSGGLQDRRVRVKRGFDELPQRLSQQKKEIGFSSRVS
jgi:hypothetical protein